MPFIILVNTIFSLPIFINRVKSFHGAVAELADAADLKSAGGDTLWVQVPPALPGNRAQGARFSFCDNNSGFLRSFSYFTSTVTLNEFLDKERSPLTDELTYNRLSVVLPAPTALNRSVTIPPAEFGLESSVYTALPS
jgi:hypothetical protein